MLSNWRIIADALNCRGKGGGILAETAGGFRVFHRESGDQSTRHLTLHRLLVSQTALIISVASSEEAEEEGG